MFVRFVAVKSRHANPWRATGIITTAKDMRDDGKLTQAEVRTLNITFNMLNHNLPCPPFNKLDDDAVCWFKASAHRFIRLMRPIITILRAHNIMVRTMRVSNPGRIIYRDKYQVVAITPRNKL